jgi:hypothetical protein
MQPLAKFVDVVIVSDPQEFRTTDTMNSYRDYLDRFTKSCVSAESVSFVGPSVEEFVLLTLRNMPQLKRVNMAACFPVNESFVNFAVRLEHLRELLLNMHGMGKTDCSSIVNAISKSASAALRHVELFNCTSLPIDAHQPLFAIPSMRRLAVRTTKQSDIHQTVPRGWAAADMKWPFVYHEAGQYKGTYSIFLVRSSVFFNGRYLTLPDKFVYDTVGGMTRTLE